MVYYNLGIFCLPTSRLLIITPIVMNIISLLKLATAFVAFSISAHAVEVFSVTVSSDTNDLVGYPTARASNFLGSDYDIYGTTDAGNGSGFGSGITRNFAGPDSVDADGLAVPSDSEVNPGDQFISTGNNPQTTTYFGPTFYAGLSRDLYKGSAGVVHAGGNGYRIRVNNVTQLDIDGNPNGTTDAAIAGNGGNDVNFKAVFLFDADLSVIGENEYLRFGATDTLNATLAVPRNMGLGTSTSVDAVTVDDGGTFDSASAEPVTVVFSDPEMEGGVAATAEVVMNAEGTAVESLTNLTAGTGYTSAPTATFAGGGVSVQPTTTISLGAATTTGANGRASLATYRPMIKASGEYYAGPLYTADLTAIETAGVVSAVYNISQEVGGDTVWTLMPSMERTNSSLQTAEGHPQNLTIITDGTETTVLGSAVENITQVGFLLETSASLNTGGFNYGVRAFSANATPGGDADGDGVADADDIHPGFDDASLTTYLNDTWLNATNLDTWLAANSYIVDDGTGGGGGGFTQQDLLDARVGSAAVDVSNGTATISLQVEQSADNMQTWSSPAEGATTVDIPVSGDATFFRVRAQ